MGEVYLARDHDLDRDVAVKVLRNGEGSDRLRRFVQEARAASGLHHPNVAHVYEIGSQDDLRFIAMEFVEGETLRQRMAKGPLPLEEVLEIGMQVAAALAAAHKQGIIHRDIKPENVIITSDGYAKVLDFGLAKLREIRGDDAATLVKTSPGVAMGTLAYMAPEQIVGGEVTPAADLFSLGVVLYEMLAGRRPFEGATTTEVVQAVMTRTPAVLHELRRDIPPKLEAVIDRALAKDAAQRWSEGAEVHEELKSISRSGAVEVRWQPVRSRAGRWTAAALAAIVVVAAGVWMYARTERRRDALRLVDRAESLIKERRLAEAYEAAMAASAVLPDDDRLRDIISRSSDRLVVESDPPGATVFLQRYGGPADRVRMGVTPLVVPRIARADYLLTVEKKGYAPVTRPISILPIYFQRETFNVLPSQIVVKLVEASRVPAGMAFVPGEPYRLTGYQRPTDRLVELQDFHLDRLEVSNRDFGEFVREGGYRRRELWKHSFIDAKRSLSFDEAMGRLRDTTGLPGPRNWSGGVPPSGREDHPVTGVTWYEAAAFCEWKGKRLPNIFQWERAAREPAPWAVQRAFPWGPVGEGSDTSERANFLGKGTMPVDSMPFGASPYGAMHMAGNVTEWCSNRREPGYAARGGSWNDNVYQFIYTSALPPFYSSPALGFRCAAGGGSEGDFEIPPTDVVPVYKTVDDRTFEEFRKRYEYVREPLNARVVERVETPDWIREKIHYTVAGKSVPAYLYLPRRVRRPLQVIHFLPAGDVTGGYRTLPHTIEVQLAPLIRGGRAVFSVELEGFLGRPRPAGWVPPDYGQEEWVEYNIVSVTEIRRGLDYLETRPDVDASRIGLYGVSAGAGPGVFVTALESRYRAVAFMGTGISLREGRFAAAANRINFLARIRAPKLMLHGRYDEDKSLSAEAEPMFRLLPEPKRLEVFEGGHAAPPEIYVPAITKWFDETMGRVEG
ncbi:MAG TPA: protein kinase [Candidatus Limnocylindria bacterium]|nr:protein kinase [Candidatus Limnocylindria bacterium]